MAGLDVNSQQQPPTEQSQAPRRSKRPARVFHSVSGAYDTLPATSSNLIPEYGASPSFHSGPDFISPIDRAVSAQPQIQQLQQQSFQTPGYDLHQPSGRNGDQFQLGQEPQAHSFAPGSSNNGTSNDVIPSLVADRANSQQKVGPTPLFKTFENTYPPPALTDFDVQDQGLSGPQFARLTMYNVPSTESLRLSTKLPLGMTLRPLAPFSHKEHECGGVSTADFSNGVPPPRCNRCRAYMNPSMLFTAGGTRFTCNMCQFENEVSSEYFQPIDVTNRRIDWQTRPELAFGTYDIIAPKEYWKDPEVEPAPLHHLVLIDVSRESIKKGLPKLAAEAVRAVIYGTGLDPGANAVSSFTGQEMPIFDEQGNPIDVDRSIKYPTKAKIGIATYDRTVQFYNLSSKLEQAQMIIMSDLEDPFVPIENGLFVDPEESRFVIEDLLDRIDLLFEDNPNDEPVYGCALDAALKALSATGGKVSAILSSLPSRGPGSLAVREGNPNFLGEKAKEIFNVDSKYYEELGKNYAISGVGLDLFLFPNTHVDLTNSGYVCQRSGGHQYFYPRFVPQRDGRTFISDFSRTCEGEIGCQAQLKVRCSTGLQVAAYYGNFFHEGWDEDPILGNIDSHSTIGVLFNYDGKLDPKLDVHFQSALLYTSSNGERRVRVTNLLASVTEQFKPAVNFVDLDATMGIIARDSITRMGEYDLKEIRERLNKRLVDVFASYRQHAGSSFPANHLLMPLSLRGFIIQMLALEKSIPLRDDKLSSDSRVHFGRVINSLSPDELSLFLYPRIVGLHNLQPTDCKYSENGLFSMPTNTKASINAMEIGGVYLAFDGQKLVLWLHRQVSLLLLKDLFGEHVTGLEALDPDLNELPELDTEVSRQARELIKYYSNSIGVKFLGFHVAREGIDNTCYEFQMLMVEDRIMNSFGYVDYVSHIYRLVKVQLEDQNEKASKTKFISDHFFSATGL
ncbi:hypothetical protein D0Z00_004245 [Geotrichum galactomycetum]|uniref:Uncharacterized protein n=1 Tax=Geotrichum galactomycetum TaxID=27317 RepID=A0ACB6UZ06_9ASCO|nr:hypothetical protein D0Z00_004245 [Geotrichum candidum]